MVLRFLTFASLNISIFFPENVLFAHQKEKQQMQEGKYGGKIKRKA